MPAGHQAFTGQPPSTGNVVGAAGHVQSPRPVLSSVSLAQCCGLSFSSAALRSRLSLLNVGSWFYLLRALRFKMVYECGPSGL